MTIITVINSWFNVRFPIAMHFKLLIDSFFDRYFYYSVVKSKKYSTSSIFRSHTTDFLEKNFFKAELQKERDRSESSRHRAEVYEQERKEKETDYAKWTSAQFWA